MQLKIDLFNIESFFCMVKVSCVWRTLEFNGRKLIDWISRLELKTSDFSFVWKIEGPKRDDAGKSGGQFLADATRRVSFTCQPLGDQFSVYITICKKPLGYFELQCIISSITDLTKNWSFVFPVLAFNEKFRLRNIIGI